MPEEIIGYLIAYDISLFLENNSKTISGLYVTTKTYFM